MLSFLVFCLFACAVLMPFFLQSEQGMLLPQREYYLLCFYEGRDATAAKQAADALSLRGGAGWMCEQGGGYAVYACAYATSTDAETVRKGIRDSGGYCTVQPLRLQGVKVRKKEEENQAILLAEQCFSICYAGFTKGYKDAESGKERALICAELSAVREKISALKKGVEQTPKTVRENTVFRAVNAFVSDCQSACELLLSESTRAALSLAAKRAQLSLLFGYRAALPVFSHK